MAIRIDSQTRSMVLECVRQVLREELENRIDYDEVWLDEKELCKQFQMFSPSFLKRHGHILPRTQVVFTDKDGGVHNTQGFAYPRNQIQRMIQNNEIKMVKA